MQRMKQQIDIKEHSGLILRNFLKITNFIEKKKERFELFEIQHLSKIEYKSSVLNIV